MSTRVERQRRMGFDVALDPAVSPGSAAALEEVGFGGAWVTETVRDPFLYLAGAASSTTDLALGTAVAIALARSPMTTALCAHDLQRWSAGRFKLGLGSQVRRQVTERFSMPWSQPIRRMREYVLALRAIWASWIDGSSLDFRGEFYTHTLMTPFFNPGPTGHPAPRVLLGAVGAQMTSVAGEVADGLICGPLTSGLSFAEHTLPALSRGYAARPTKTPQKIPEPFEIGVMPLIVTGADTATTLRIARATRARIAFYGSTPSYRAILDLHGWGTLHDRLHKLSRCGDWAAMTDLIDDEILDTFAVVADPDHVAAAVQQRFGRHAHRAILHAASDPGLEVWRCVLSASASRPACEEANT